MSDQIFLHLCDGWAVAADNLQWVILKVDKRGHQAEKRHRRAPWRAVSFIGSAKDVLRRVLREKAVTPTPEAEAALDAMPDTFREWLRRHEASAPAPNQPANIGRAA